MENFEVRYKKTFVQWWIQLYHVGVDKPVIFVEVATAPRDHQPMQN